MSLRSPLTRALAATTATLAIGGMTASAFAEDVIVTADTTSLTGTRVLTTTPTALTLLDNSAGGLAASLTVTVTETAAAGADWNVTASSTAFTNTVLGLDAIAASNFSAAPGTASATVTLPAEVSITDGTGGTLDSAVSLFSVSGESATSSYTNVFSQATTFTLTIPNGAQTGARTATLTIDLL